jgi:Spondin_N
MTRLITFISAATLIGVCAITLIGVGKTDRVAEFTVRIEDVSNRHTLHTSTGDKVVGLSPGMWVLHTGNNPIYLVGARASTGLQRLAEDGNPEGLYSDLQVNPAVKGIGAYNVAMTPYPVAGFIGPGQAYEFIVSNASPGDRLSFATMFIDSNDWFYSNNSTGIDLFNADRTPFSGDVTAQVGLFDAGTEANEEPGVGPNQAPRQPRPRSGQATDEAVYAIVGPAVGASVKGNGDRSWGAPPVADVIKVTITPRTR